ncbi:MAG: hypothetical protein JRN19_03310 [Nitrososphaerota archaeon]|nr:hypothetical protein [Nitrososphaerota archaeon]
MMKNAYELRSINLFNLPQEEAAGVLDDYADFLNSLLEPVEIRIIEDVRQAALGDEIYRQPYKRYFISSDEPLDNALMDMRVKFVKVPSVPLLKIRSNVRRFMVDEDGCFVECWNLVALSNAMNTGFLTDLYPFAHEIRITICPVENGKQLAMSHAYMMRSKIALREKDARAVDPSAVLEADGAQRAANSIAAGNEKLFMFRVTIVLRAKDDDELLSKEKALLAQLRGLVDSPLGLQRAMYEGAGPSWALGRLIYAPTSTLLAFFPFSGLDLIDPEGVMLGQNLQTGNVLLYDIFDRKNYNVSILGQTGAGKSTLIKSWVSRLAAQDDESYIYIFDSIAKPEYSVGPDGNYEGSFASMIGAKVLDFKGDTYLDPLSIFEGRQAAQVVEELAGVDEPEMKDELRMAAEGAEDLDELMEKLEARRASLPAGDPSSATIISRLEKRLSAELKPFDHLFRGELKMWDRMVFSLYDLDRTTRDIVAFLVLARVWRTIRSLPVSACKAVVIDEGWAFVEDNPKTGRPYFPMAVEYVPEIARTGRHYNTAFFIATQQVSDMMTGPGKAMLQNSATKVILKQDTAATDILANEMALSPEDRRFVLNARTGQGMLLSPEGHIPFFNSLAKSELAAFTTRPKDVSA